jgi:hypothetical protein
MDQYDFVAEPSMDQPEYLSFQSTMPLEMGIPPPSTDFPGDIGMGNIWDFSDNIDWVSTCNVILLEHLRFD